VFLKIESGRGNKRAARRLPYARAACRAGSPPEFVEGIEPVDAVLTVDVDHDRGGSARRNTD
jgi:hypothetical protein